MRIRQICVIGSNGVGKTTLIQKIFSCSQSDDNMKWNGKFDTIPVEIYEYNEIPTDQDFDLYLVVFDYSTSDISSLIEQVDPEKTILVRTKDDWSVNTWDSITFKTHKSYPLIDFVQLSTRTGKNLDSFRKLLYHFL